MHNDRRHIDDLFREGLKGLRKKPPHHAWSRLEEDLRALGTGKRMLFLRLAAASVLILLAFGAGYYFAIYSTNQTGDTLTSTEERPSVVPGGTLNTQGEKDIQQIENTNSLSLPKVSKGIAEPEIRKPDLEIPVDLSPDLAGSIPQETNLAETPSSQRLPDEQEIQRIVPLPVHSTLLTASGQVPVIAAKNVKTNTLLEPYLVGDYSDIGERTGPNKYAWSVGAQFAPTYSYRDISTNYGAGATGNPAADENYDAVEDPLLSYAGGLQVDYRVYGNWRLESGVYFSRIGQVNNDALQFKQGNNEYILTAINTSTGGINVAYERVPESVKRINSPKDTIGISGVENVKIVQQFDLFEIPFLVKYQMLNRKFSMHVSGGLSPAYLVDNHTYLEMEDRKYDVGDAGNLNNMIVNTSLGVGFEYLITKNLAVNLEPTFKYSLSPINNNSNFSYHPYYFSWFTGIRLRIN